MTWRQQVGEEYVQAGDALIRLGRWMQRTIGPFNVERGQDGEADILDSLLPGDGCYVDVGASHPIECSNTWQLYRRGWRGLLIEPLPECWFALLRVRPGDYVCPVAAHGFKGHAQMGVCRTVSSFRPDWPIEPQCQLIAEVAPMREILSWYPSVRDRCRLMSIDVEGLEKEVLEGMDWTTCRPEVLVVEYRKYDPRTLGSDESHQWAPILKTAGYTLLRSTAYNQVWSRS